MVAKQPRRHAFLAPSPGLQILLQGMGFQTKRLRSRPWDHEILVWPPTVVSGRGWRLWPCLQDLLSDQRSNEAVPGTALGGSLTMCNHSGA